MGHYVHSGVDNFYKDGNLEILNTNPRAQFHRDVYDSIPQLESIRKSLETATDAFLGGRSVEELNERLKNPINYSDFIEQLLSQNRNEYVKALTPKINTKKYIENFYSDKGRGAAGRRFIKTLADKGIDAKDPNTVVTVKQMVEATIAAAFPTSISGLSRGNVKRNIATQFGIKSDDVANAMAKRGFQYFTSETNNIQTLFKDLLTQQLEGTDIASLGESNINSFITQLEEDFKKKIGAKDDIDFSLSGYENFSVADYLNDFETVLRNELKPSSGGKSNAVGDIGEIVRVAARQTDLNSIAIEVTTGNQTEDVVSDIVSERFDTSIKKMNTYKRTNKLSGSDVIFKLNDGNVIDTTKVARAQIKESTGEYDVKDKNGNTIEKQIIVRIQNSTNLKELLDALAMQGFVLDQESLTTVIANVVWFKTHKSVQRANTGRGLDEKQDVGSKTNLFPRLNKAMSLALSQAVTEFLGVTTEEQINGELAPIISASNLFYIANGWYTPTYKIIDKVIAAMKEYLSDNAFDLSKSTFYVVVEDKPSVSWTVNDPVDFWRMKVEGWEEGENSSHGYSSAQEVGEAQAPSDLLSLIKVHSNLRLTTMMSSYSFK